MKSWSGLLATEKLSHALERHRNIFGKRLRETAITEKELNASLRQPSGGEQVPGILVWRHSFTATLPSTNLLFHLVPSDFPHPSSLLVIVEVT